MARFLFLVLAGGSLLGGCVAKTAFTVVTLPVKAAGKAIDLATTSPSEADRNRDRKMRRAEEREARERHAHDNACRRDPANCGPYTGFRANPPRDD